MIKPVLEQKELRLHAIRFDYGLTTASMQPYNSTDVNGYKHTLIQLCQLAHKLQVQYLFNLQSETQWGKQTKLSNEELQKKIK